MDCTLVVSYYNEPDLLTDFLDHLNVHFFKKVIIVDDGSERAPAYPIVMKYPHYHHMLSLFRVKEDIGFNSHGAKNLAMQHVETEWAFLSDMDLVIPNDTLLLLEEAAKDSEGKYFHFKISWKNRDIPLEDCKETVNTCAIRTKDFWIAGGYDEEWVPHHVGDKHLFYRIDQYLKRTVIDGYIIAKRKGRSIFYKDGLEKPVYGNCRINPVGYFPPITSLEKGRLLRNQLERNANPELWVRDSIINFEWEQLL